MKQKSNFSSTLINYTSKKNVMHSYKLRNGYYHKKMTLTELILCNGKGKYS